MTTSAIRRLMATYDVDQREPNHLSIRFGHCDVEHRGRFIRIML